LIKGFTTEAKVGIFVLIGIGFLSYMTVVVGGFKTGDEKGYIMYVDFENIAGVEVKAPVTMAGVEMGKVENISLQNGKARVVLRIREGAEIRTDSMAMVKATGLLGDKYIEISPGTGSAALLKDGETVREGRSADLDRLIGQLSSIAGDIKDVSSTLSKVLGGEKGQASLRNIIDSVKNLTSNLDRMIAANEKRFNDTMVNFQAFSGDLKKITADNREAIKALVANLNDFSGKINTMADDNKDNLKTSLENLKVASVKVQSSLDSITSITRKIDEGEGTLGKLVNDDSLHTTVNEALTGINDYIAGSNKFKFYINYRGEYLTEESDVKSYLSLRIQPKSDYYYLLGLVDDPSGKVTIEDKVTSTVPGGTVSTHEERTTENVKFDVQVAKRFHDLTLRGGIFESTGGAGIDYHLFNDNAKLTAEIFDFSKEKDPNLKAKLDYNFYRHLFVTAGVDEILKSRERSFFMGGGIRFEDDDLKYLLAGSSIP